MTDDQERARRATERAKLGPHVDHRVDRAEQWARRNAPFRSIDTAADVEAIEREIWRTGPPRSAAERIWPHLPPAPRPGAPLPRGYVRVMPPKRR